MPAHILYIHTHSQVEIPGQPTITKQLQQMQEVVDRVEGRGEVHIKFPGR